MTATLWWLLQNLITVMLLTPLVCVACRVLWNRPALRHALWLVVLVKFVTPPIVSWPLPSSVIGETGGRFVDSGDRHAAQPAPPVGAARRSDKPGIAPSAETHFGVHELDGVHSVEATVPLRSARAAEHVARLTLPTLFSLWMAGCAIALLLNVRRIAQQRAVVHQAKAAPKPLADEVAGVAAALGVRPVRALVAREIATPFVWCFGRLRLLWPESLAHGAGLARSRGIIAHELAHVRRRDHWAAWLELAAGVIWWWNPLFWFVRRRLRESAEMACDAIALSVYDDRREYAEVFLELSTGFKNGAPAPVLGVSTGAPSLFERRLSMILSDRVSGKFPVWGILLVACLAAVTLPGWSLAQVSSAEERQAERPPSGGEPGPDTSGLASGYEVIRFSRLADASAAWELLRSSPRLSREQLSSRLKELGADTPSVTLTTSLRDAPIPRRARRSHGDVLRKGEISPIIHSGDALFIVRRVDGLSAEAVSKSDDSGNFDKSKGVRENRPHDVQTLLAQFDSVLQNATHKSKETQTTKIPEVSVWDILSFHERETRNCASCHRIEHRQDRSTETVIGDALRKADLDKPEERQVRDYLTESFEEGKKQDTTLPPSLANANEDKPLPPRATWTVRWDHELDGKIVSDSPWELQLDFRNDKVSGHVLKIPDGTLSDSIWSGEVIRSTAPTVKGKGSVSVLVLRQDTSNGYFVINTARRVSANRFLGTWVDNMGRGGDCELTLMGTD